MAARGVALMTVAVLSVTCLSSCFAVTDLDRFDKVQAATGNFTDLRLTVRGMKSHVNELFEFRVVDSTRTIQSRGFVIPLGGEDATLFVRGAVPKQNGPFNLDFYADHDSSGGYDVTVPDADHAWRLPLNDGALDDRGTYTIVFDHNTSFNYLNDPTPPREIGKGTKVKLRNMGAYIGKRVEVRVADKSSRRVVGLYRIPRATAAELEVSIPGMVESGVTYDIELYTDDGVASPGSIKAFQLVEDAGPTGLDVVFDPSGPSVTPVANPDVP